MQNPVSNMRPGGTVSGRFPPPDRAGSVVAVRHERSMEPSAILQLYAMLLLIGLPALATRDAGRVGDVERAAEFRRAIYVSIAFSLVFIALLTMGIAWWQGVSGKAMGWTVADFRGALIWALAAAAAGLLTAWIVGATGRRLSWSEGGIARLLMPRSAPEKRAFLVLAGVGAVCEEYVYRGFLLWVVTAWSGGPEAAVAVTSLSFGLAHGYQKLPGILRATLLGVVLAVPVVITGSLFAAVVAHFWINAAIGLGGWRWLVADNGPEGA